MADGLFLGGMGARFGVFVLVVWCWLLKVLVCWWSALDFSKAAAEVLRDPKSNKKYEKVRKSYFRTFVLFVYFLINLKGNI